MLFFFFFQAEDGIRDFCLSRGLGDVYKRQVPFRRQPRLAPLRSKPQSSELSKTQTGNRQLVARSSQLGAENRPSIVRLASNLRAFRYLTPKSFRFNRLRNIADPEPSILKQLAQGNRNGGGGGGSPLHPLFTVPLSTIPCSSVQSKSKQHPRRQQACT